MAQTTVTSGPAVAKEGLLYDAQGSPDGIVSGLVEETNGVKPGRCVVRGSGDDFAASLPAGAVALTTNVLGVSLHSHKARALDPSSANNEVYEDGASLPVARQRRVWVKVEDAFTPASAVFVRVTANGGNTEIGGFRTDGDSGNAIAWTAAKFITSGGAGAFGVLEINI